MNDPKRIVVVLLGLVLVGIGTLGIKGHMNSNGYKNQVNYTTAIQSTEKDNFNYIVDSQQGRVLANGDFSTTDNLAKFDEMNKGFTYVKRDKEHYTMHTSTICSGEPVHCTTTTYYTWDRVDSEEKYADKITFMEREYPATLFNFDKYSSNTNCSEFASAGNGTGFFETKRGCVDGNWYIDDNDRYVYSTVPVTFNASFLASTYGGLKPFEEKSITLQNKSIEKILHDVGRYELISFWVVTILLIILVISAGFAAYVWVFEDGVWSTED